MNGFKYLVEISSIGVLAKHRTLYVKGQRVKPYIYIVPYGAFTCETKNGRRFGDLMCVGHTLGEESLFSTQKQRSETVSTCAQSCVL